MSSDNLRALFSPGRTPSISAQQVFTNRVEEAAALDTARSTMDLVAAIESVDDLARSRQNVLVFYGTGGIGKTALSAELERRLSATDRSPLAIRLDPQVGATASIEMLLLQLRVGLGQLAPRWPAFDLAFAVHWSQRHPDRSIDEVLAGDSKFGRMAKRIGVSDQIQSALEEVSADLISTAVPVAAAQRIGSHLFDQIRRAVQSRRLLADCAMFQPLLEAPPSDETCSYMAALLGWELARHQRAGNVGLPVVFIDNFEIATASDELEAQLQRLIYLLPNALFVLTGRDRLSWAEGTVGGHLDYVGPECWPGLVASVQTEPRQHLLAFLSDQDCDLYLRSALTEDDQPVMPPDIRERIVAGSGGLPLYLDLAVSHFLALRANGRSPEPESFGGPLPAVISRAIRDLDPEERRALFGASMFSRFDTRLASVAGGVPDAAGVRLARRPFVDVTEDPLPLSLHDLLRDGIRSGAELKDAWSPDEWVEAATRALRLLEARWQGAGDDWAVSMGALRAAVDAARITSHVPDWLLDAGIALAEAGFWNALGAVTDSGERGTELDAVVLGLRGITQRRLTSLEDSQRSLAAALDHGGLSERQRAVFRLHLAHAVRNSGNYAEAADAYEALCGLPVADVARAALLQLADLRMLRGRFREALAMCDELDSSEATPAAHEVTELHRLRGHIHRFNGDFDAARRHYLSALRLAEGRSAIGEVAKAQTNLAETSIWSAPSDAGPLIDAAIVATAEVGNALDQPKLIAASCCVAPDLDQLERLLDEGIAVTTFSGYRSGEAFLRWTACHAALRLGDRRRAEAEQERLDDLTRSLGVYRFLTAIAGLWLGTATSAFEEFEWLEPERAKRAWATLPGLLIP